MALENQCSSTHAAPLLAKLQLPMFNQLANKRPIKTEVTRCKARHCSYLVSQIRVQVIWTNLYTMMVRRIYASELFVPSPIDHVPVVQFTFVPVDEDRAFDSLRLDVFGAYVEHAHPKFGLNNIDAV